MYGVTRVKFVLEYLDMNGNIIGNKTQLFKKRQNYSKYSHPMPVVVMRGRGGYLDGLGPNAGDDPFLGPLPFH